MNKPFEVCLPPVLPTIVNALAKAVSKFATHPC